MGFDGIVGSTGRVTYRARHLSGAFDQVQAPLNGSLSIFFLDLVWWPGPCRFESHGFEDGAMTRAH